MQIDETIIFFLTCSSKSLINREISDHEPDKHHIYEGPGGNGKYRVPPYPEHQETGPDAEKFRDTIGRFAK